MSVMQVETPVMDEIRLIEIETKVAHQERLLSELNDALTDQQSQIGRLELLCQSLIDRLKSLAESVGPGESTDERPPHY
jgi:SlyX protein